MKGGDITLGREKLREMLRTTFGSDPVFQVSRCAGWTLRALSGGYAREPDKTEATPGPYRLIGEPLESFAASAEASEGDRKHEAAFTRFTPDGRRYLSSVVRVPRRHERAEA
jgi:hypothetical protein